MVEWIQKKKTGMNLHLGWKYQYLAKVPRMTLVRGFMVTPHSKRKCCADEMQDCVN